MSGHAMIYHAVYLILERDGRFLLARRANTGFADGCWSLPAGHVEAGESASQAMAREAQEEIGLTRDPAALRHVYTLHRRSADRTYVDQWFYLADDDAVIDNREPHKCDALTWFAPDALPQETLPYVRRVLTEFRHGHYGEMGF
ncbi:NUDIX hydrolase [Edwardsiella piscicida]|uniref:NUDIX hydrolase n=1 Tax=Edwardsiella piscicida TaxID=1263550 RepID=UPI000AC43336